MNTLKTYMGCCLDEPGEGAILIFAHNVREAKRIAWQSNSFIHDICDSYLDLRVTRLKDYDYLFAEANQEKLKNGVAHIKESPTSCNGCLKWGYELNDKGFCESCAEDV